MIKVFRGYCTVQKINYAINVHYDETRSVSIVEQCFKKGMLECAHAAEAKDCHEECPIYKIAPGELKILKGR